MDLKITIKPANRIRHPKIARDFMIPPHFIHSGKKTITSLMYSTSTVMRFLSRKNGQNLQTMLLTITRTTMISVYIQYRNEDCDKESTHT